MHCVRLARHAMATRFEFVLLGEDQVRLRAAGEEALAEIQALEKRLSFYSQTSELSQINRRAAREPVRVASDVFELLQTALRLSQATDGAFDPTVAPLMRCWGFVRSTGRFPDERELSDARRVTGMNLVHLDEENSTIRFTRPGVELDLGGIAKGYALDEAAAHLRSAGIEHALLHGGTSTIVAMGRSFDESRWRVGIVRKDASILGTVELSDCTMSVSAVTGKAFVRDGMVYGHVIDPRTGKPAKGASLAAVVAESATVSDALSTAALLLGFEAHIISDLCTGWGIDIVQSQSEAFIQERLPGFRAVT